MKLKQEIKITTLAIDEGDDTIHYRIEVTNGINTTAQDFYGYADNFKKFAMDYFYFQRRLLTK